MNIPFLSFEAVNKQIKAQILQSFEQFFDNAWYVLGDSIKTFEKQYAEYNGVTSCVGVSNGLDALHLALKVLEVGPGDEVIVPSNTYIATILAISYVGATPVLVEPDPKTYNLDPEKIEAAINAKTKAIMPVHLYGQACEMDKIMAVAKKYNLRVVEDNAQAHGATFNRKMTGSWGDVNGTSFYPGKNLGAFGDAGAITTDNELLAAKVAVLRNYGSERKYFNEVIGHNMRLDECQAAFLSVKLPFLNGWTLQRQEIAGWYDHALSGINNIVLPYTIQGATHVYHLYVIRTKYRDELQKHLAQNGIGSLIHYPIPPHMQGAYQHLGFKEGDFPIAEEIAKTCLSLPMFPGMTEENVSEIAKTIKSLLN